MRVLPAVPDTCRMSTALQSLPLSVPVAPAWLSEERAERQGPAAQTGVCCPGSRVAGQCPPQCSHAEQNGGNEVPGLVLPSLAAFGVQWNRRQTWSLAFMELRLVGR